MFLRSGSIELSVPLLLDPRPLRLCRPRTATLSEGLGLFNQIAGTHKNEHWLVAAPIAQWELTTCPTDHLLTYGMATAGIGVPTSVTDTIDP
jgi:hypothetical protein